jgi:hypothetical protein
MLQTLEAFLGYAADDFIIKTDSRPCLELAWRIFLPHSQHNLRALLAARSPSTQRPPIGPHMWRSGVKSRRSAATDNADRAKAPLRIAYDQAASALA